MVLKVTHFSKKFENNYLETNIQKDNYFGPAPASPACPANQSQQASQPASQPESQPASQPASRPASCKPASQQPASPQLSKRSAAGAKP
jgi:hypothetical protein